MFCTAAGRVILWDQQRQTPWTWVETCSPSQDRKSRYLPSRGLERGPAAHTSPTVPLLVFVLSCLQTNQPTDRQTGVKAQSPWRRLSTLSYSKDVPFQVALAFEKSSESPTCLCSWHWLSSRSEMWAELSVNMVCCCWRESCSCRFCSLDLWHTRPVLWSCSCRVNTWGGRNRILTSQDQWALTE